MAPQVGLVRGEWVAIDGSKLRAVSSAQAVREREAVKRYLDQLENADQRDEVIIDERAVAAALEKRKHDPEPKAWFRRMRQRIAAPAYNVQTTVTPGPLLHVRGRGPGVRCWRNEKPLHHHDRALDYAPSV
jgi:hypothetical protein